LKVDFLFFFGKDAENNVTTLKTYFFWGFVVALIFLVFFLKVKNWAATVHTVVSDYE
jgi:hypothetical protein